MVGQGSKSKESSPIKFLVISIERNKGNFMCLWEVQTNRNRPGTGGESEQLQQITQFIQLAKIIEVFYKCIPVVQILLFSIILLGGGVWEGGREVRGP